MTDTVEITTAHLSKLRSLLGGIPGSGGVSIQSVRPFDIDTLLEDLENCLLVCRTVVDNQEDELKSLRQLKSDVRAMRRVLWTES